MIDPKKENLDGTPMIFRKLDTKKDKGTQETWILTVEVENKETLDEEQLDELLPGAAAAWESIQATGGKRTTTLKSDSSPFGCVVGHFSANGRLIEHVKGAGARVISTKLVLDSEKDPVLVQRIRFTGIEPGVVTKLGRLLRRQHLEINIQVGKPQQVGLFDGEFGDDDEGGKVIPMGDAAK